MLADNSLVLYFYRYVSSYWQDNKQICGHDIIRLGWAKEAAETLINKLDDLNFIKTVNAYFEPYGELGPELKEEFRLKIVSPYKFEPMNYFKKRGIKYTLVKTGDNNYELIFTKDSLKKNIINFCAYSVDKENFSITIMPKAKLNIEEFLKEAFIFSNNKEWARIDIRAQGEKKS